MSRVDVFVLLPEEAKSVDLWKMLELMSEPIVVEPRESTALLSIPITAISLDPRREVGCGA